MRAMRRFPSVTSGESRRPAACIRSTRRSIRVRVSSHTMSSRSSASASAAKVRSSGVGPSPPDRNTCVTSSSASSRRTCSTTSCGRSGIAGRGGAGSRWELVSSVKPPTSSSPMATMLELGTRATYNLEKVERLHGVIHGDVHGVGFRYFLMREAQRLGLRGWVRNRDDGTVEFVAEGRRTDLDRLKQAAERGPQMAQVEKVDAEWSAAAGGLDSFDLTG